MFFSPSHDICLVSRLSHYFCLVYISAVDWFVARPLYRYYHSREPLQVQKIRRNDFSNSARFMKFHAAVGGKTRNLIPNLRLKKSVISEEYLKLETMRLLLHHG